MYRYLVTFSYCTRSGAFGFGNTFIEFDHAPPTVKEINATKPIVNSRCESELNGDACTTAITGFFRLSEEDEAAE